mmetsp:Transcript_4951/g.9205  ORF Transcript_4951/g.9205 Transcript_4951/m.9205 type:complete len:97 (+) Transcript_4951:729-1019(+)
MPVYPIFRAHPKHFQQCNVSSLSKTSDNLAKIDFERSWLDHHEMIHPKYHSILSITHRFHASYLLLKKFTTGLVVTTTNGNLRGSKHSLTATTNPI